MKQTNQSVYQKLYKAKALYGDGRGDKVTSHISQDPNQ